MEHSAHSEGFMQAIHPHGVIPSCTSSHVALDCGQDGEKHFLYQRQGMHPWVLKLSPVAERSGLQSKQEGEYGHKPCMTGKDILHSGTA